MPDIKDTVSVAVVTNLETLSWKCQGCPQVSVCEDNAQDGEPRYCLPIIRAAILNQSDWRTRHDPNSLRRRSSAQRGLKKLRGEEVTP